MTAEERTRERSGGHRTGEVLGTQVGARIGGKRQTILVVGDSFVDENWLTSKYDIYHSYNVGHDHYISNLPDTKVKVLSLCGAASIWRILKGNDADGSAGTSFREKFDLVGLSAWNPQDHDLLMCLLCPIGDQAKRVNPYLLSGLQRPSKQDNGQVCPYTKSPCTQQPGFVNLIESERGDHTSTNRLIRVYTGFGGDQPRLEYRYDWRLAIGQKDKKELQTSAENGGELHKEPERWPLLIQELLDKSPSAVTAIIVADHGYGVMDRPLAAALHRAFPSARWYVRSKVDAAEWLDCLYAVGATVRLAFTDEQLLRYQYGTRIWRQGPKVIGRGALEALGDLLGLEKSRDTDAVPAERPRAANAALLLDDDTAIGATRTSAQKGHPATPNAADPREDAAIANVHRSPGPLQPIRVGRSTVFFTSLVYWDLMKGIDRESIGKATTWAVANAYNWTEKCSKAWLEESPTHLSGPFDEAMCSEPEPDAGQAPSPLSYLESWEEWNDSSRGLGLQRGKPGGTREIHLWRARVGVGEYICPGGKKRSQINELIRRLGVYKATNAPAHPFNCLFLGEPGWGKSFLAQAIAERFEFQFVSFSVAGMGSNKDLMDAMKSASSLQNETGRRLLIFVDEIDALIEGNSAMGLLLGPMWDGTLKAEGIVYRIQPCVWVFASTKSVSRLQGESKGRDFLARINGLVVDLDFFRGGSREDLDKLQDEKSRLGRMELVARQPESYTLRTELVYHGVNCLNRLFGPISSIDRRVLAMFNNALPINGVRSLEIWVSRFRNVSGGKVSVENVPRFEDYPELRRHILPLDGWPKDGAEGEETIRVIANPPT